jgi:hypothetical protein
MHIELDAATIESIKNRACEHVLGELIAELRASLNRKQLIEEVKNAAVKEVSAKLAVQVSELYGEQAIKRAVDSVATRVNTQIHRRLQQGIIVKFGEEL